MTPPPGLPLGRLSPQANAVVVTLRCCGGDAGDTDPAAVALHLALPHPAARAVATISGEVMARWWAHGHRRPQLLDVAAPRLSVDEVTLLGLLAAWQGTDEVRAHSLARRLVVPGGVGGLLGAAGQLAGVLARAKRRLTAEDTRWLAHWASEWSHPSSAPRRVADLSAAERWLLAGLRLWAHPGRRGRSAVPLLWDHFAPWGTEVIAGGLDRLLVTLDRARALELGCPGCAVVSGHEGQLLAAIAGAQGAAHGQSRGESPGPNALPTPLEADQRALVAVLLTRIGAVLAAAGVKLPIPGGGEERGLTPPTPGSDPGLFKTQGI
ncbi:MAG: hypothetical protein ACFCBW_04190 [Candidatus Competibacterales bacterium]